MDPDDQQRGYLWAEPTPARSDHMLNAFASDGQVVSVNASQASTVELTGLGLGTRTSYTVNLAEADVEEQQSGDAVVLKWRVGEQVGPWVSATFRLLTDDRRAGGRFGLDLLHGVTFHPPRPSRKRAATPAGAAPPLTFRPVSAALAASSALAPTTPATAGCAAGSSGGAASHEVTPDSPPRARVLGPGSADDSSECSPCCLSSASPSDLFGFRGWKCRECDWKNEAMVPSCDDCGQSKPPKRAVSPDTVTDAGLSPDPQRVGSLHQFPPEVEEGDEGQEGAAPGEVSGVDDRFPLVVYDNAEGPSPVCRPLTRIEESFLRRPVKSADNLASTAEAQETDWALFGCRTPCCTMQRGHAGPCTHGDEYVVHRLFVLDGRASSEQEGLDPAFLVQWEGWDLDFCTWESVEEMEQGYPALVQEWKEDGSPAWSAEDGE
jgi:hypothetical protein